MLFAVSTSNHTDLQRILATLFHFTYDFQLLSIILRQSILTGSYIGEMHSGEQFQPNQVDIVYKLPQKATSLTSKNLYQINPGQIVYITQIHYIISVPFDVEKAK